MRGFARRSGPLFGRTSARRGVAIYIVALGLTACFRGKPPSDGEVRALEESVSRECARLPAVGGPFSHTIPIPEETESDACKQAVAKLMSAYKECGRLGVGRD